MASVNLLLKRKITGAPRAVMNRLRKLLKAALARLWKLMWAILLAPFYALAVHAETRTGRLAFAERLLTWMDRLPVYLEFHAQRLMQVQIERGKVAEPAAIAMHICRLNPTPATVAAANAVWSEFAQTEPGWQAVASAPRLNAKARHAAVITRTGEDLFGDLLEQLRYDFTSHSITMSDDSPVVAECVLDRVATHIAGHFTSDFPNVVIAAPANLTDYKTLAVADAVARWAGCPLIMRLPIANDRPANTEIASRSHSKFSELLTRGHVVTADSQLLKQLAAIDGVES